MRYVRDFFRKLKYKIKFFGKKKEMDIFYISNSKINTRKNIVFLYTQNIIKILKLLTYNKVGFPTIRL